MKVRFSVGDSIILFIAYQVIRAVIFWGIAFLIFHTYLNIAIYIPPSASDAHFIPTAELLVENEEINI